MTFVKRPMKKGKLRYRLVLVDKENRNRRTYAGVVFESGVEEVEYNVFLSPGVSLNYQEQQDIYHINLVRVDEDPTDEEDRVGSRRR